MSDCCLISVGQWLLFNAERAFVFRHSYIRNDDDDAHFVLDQHT